MPDLPTSIIDILPACEHLFTVKETGLSPEDRLHRVLDTLEAQADRIQDQQQRRLILTVATELVESALEQHRVPAPPHFED